MIERYHDHDPAEVDTGSTWSRRDNGTEFTVVAVTASFPRTVIYRSVEDGEWHTCLLSTWRETMRLTGDIF